MVIRFSESICGPNLGQKQKNAYFCVIISRASRLVQADLCRPCAQTGPHRCAINPWGCLLARVSTHLRIKPAVCQHEKYAYALLRVLQGRFISAECARRSTISYLLASMAGNSFFVLKTRTPIALCGSRRLYLGELQMARHRF